MKKTRSRNRRTQGVREKADWLLSLDQGSTSSRAVLFDSAGRVRAQARSNLSHRLPRPGWVEHSPEEILSTQLHALGRVLRQAGASRKRILALGIANQRSTLLVWDRRTGRPLAPAISWQDRRAAELCRAMAGASRAANGLTPEELVFRKTGLRLSPHYAGPKLAWLLEKRRDLRKRAEGGDLLCGTVNTYLIWHLTGGKVHMTDPTNAARMLLMDLPALSWDPSLLGLFGIPPAVLPRIAPSSARHGEARIGGMEIPICCSIGDQQAASIGLGCAVEGAVTLNYGTGGFLLLNTGNRIRPVPRLLSSIAWSTPEEAAFLLEGTVNSVGSAVDWLKHGLGLYKYPGEISKLYSRSRHPVPTLPALAGLGAPFWRESMQGVMFDLSPRTRPADLVRGTLEGIAFLMMAILETIRSEGIPLPGPVRAAGGLARLDPLMQFQADLFGMPIARPRNVEATALGAAFMAGLGSGRWSHPSEIRALRSPCRTFKPGQGRREAERSYNRWKNMVDLVLAGRLH